MKEFIVKNTKIVSDHLTPEIKLRLITPDCSLYYETNLEKLPFRDPFWSIYWPGGQGVARYVLDNPQIVKNKSVLDFGAGSGACGIAALKSGAKGAVANDIDEIAVIAASMNAELNYVQLETDARNLIGNEEICNKFDVVILGDVFYDSEIAKLLIPWLEMLLKHDKVVLIGDPGRHALDSNLKLKLLSNLLLPDNVRRENHGFDYTNVWQFSKSS